MTKIRFPMRRIGRQLDQISDSVADGTRARHFTELRQEQQLHKKTKTTNMSMSRAMKMGIYKQRRFLNTVFDGSFFEPSKIVFKISFVCVYPFS